MDSTVIDTGAKSPNKKGRIILRNLDEEQKKEILSKGSTALLGLLGGAGSFSLMSFVDKSDFAEINSTQDEIDAAVEIEEPVVIYTEAPFAESVSDDMSFAEAFDAAREEVGPGGIFEWNGNSYNTYTKTEFDSLTEQDRQDYVSSITDHIERIKQENIQEEIADNEVIESESLDSELLGVTVDADGDGIVDAVGVDHNNNDMIDIMVDIDGDGKMDAIVLDVDESIGVTGNEEIVSLEDNESNEIVVDNDALESTSDDTLIAENSDIDRYDDIELNPDYDIDNDVNMNEYS